MNKSPLALLILDGWGHRLEQDDNAIAHANTPFWDELVAHHPSTTISGSGGDVGLPDGQMGNSEVGHLNIGAGRIVRQDYSRITHDIENCEFANNKVLSEGLEQVINRQSRLHIFGLLSPGGVHSHEDHIAALCQLANDKGIKNIALHAFLDGRDTPPKSASTSLERFDTLFSELECGQIATVCGRYFAMDRDSRWERIEKAYRAIVEGKADSHAGSALQALETCYEQGIADEFVTPTIINSKDNNTQKIVPGDVVIFMNFRADRARQLSHALTDRTFEHFGRSLKGDDIHFITLTQYEANIQSEVAYPPLQLNNVLGEVLSKEQLKQLRIAETEKYAHVTFFFNGGVESPFSGEERILVPSPDVATYDLQPEMNAAEVTDSLVTAIEEDRFDVYICNFANPDMVGHTGNFNAAIKAIETIDTCLSRIIAALKAKQGSCIITADHGNAEQMHCHETNQPHTAHTCELVPFVFVGKTAKIKEDKGTLSDIAPTMLYILGIHQPSEMTGRSLIEFSDMEN